MKLHRQLLILALAAVLPLAVLSAFLGAGELRQGQDAVRRQAQASVDALATDLERELNGQAETVSTLALSPQFDASPDPAWFADYGQRLLQAHPLWMAMSLTDPDGRRLMDAPALPPGIPGQVIDAESHAQAVETRRTVVGRILMSPRGNVAYAVFAPVIRDGAVRYVIGVVIRPTETLSLLRASKLPEHWRAGVLDQTQHVVTRTLEPDVPTLEASPEARQALDQAPAGAYRSHGLDGLPLVVAYRVLPDSGWSVHVAMPRSAYEAPLVRAVGLLAVSGLASLFLAGLFLWLLSRELGLRQSEAAAAEESRRLEALGRMTGGVAHDFNNLLMVVQGSAELLRRRVTGNEGATALIDAILAAASRSHLLTRQLLAFGRRSAHKPVSFRLQDRGPAMLEMVRRSVTDRIETRLELAPDAWAVHADPEALEIALLNLAVNARDAMPSGGVLTIAARNIALQPGRDEGTGLEGEFVALGVADTGAGIAAEHLRHVFEPFYTTKAPGRGTGLGLSQVYGFARQSGGAAKIKSAPGEGTTVTLYLPRGEAPPKAAGADAQEARGDGRVLMVEQDPDVAALTLSMLAAAGFEASRQADGAAALAALDRGEPADAMLIGGDAGGRPASKLAKAARARRPGLAVVVMTGSSGMAGVDGKTGVVVLPKPFGHAELVEAIGRARGAFAEASPEDA